MTNLTSSQTLFIGSRVMKLGQQVACRETFKIMWLWMSLTEGQGQSWNSEHIYPFVIILHNISDTIYSRVMKLRQMVACGETFKMTWHWANLTKSQRHILYLKVKKYPFLTNLTIFQTLFIGSRVMKLDPQVACGETFKVMWYWVILTEGQGHSLFESQKITINLW